MANNRFNEIGSHCKILNLFFVESWRNIVKKIQCKLDKYINNEPRYLDTCRVPSSYRYDLAMLLALSVKNVPWLVDLDGDRQRCRDRYCHRTTENRHSGEHSNYSQDINTTWQHFIEKCTNISLNLSKLEAKMYGWRETGKLCVGARP